MNERTVFLAALDITDPAERSIYLDRACAGNSKLRQQVDALLMANDRSGEFLNVPALRQMVDNPDVTQTSEMKNESKFDLAYLTPSTKPGSLGTLGHYEVMRVLGQGGFGTVLKAFDEKLHRMVAIKVLSRQLAATSPPRKRFIREARAVAAIKHENVVQVYSVEEQPLPYIVMELVDGSTLQDKMDEAGPIDIPEVLHIGRQIAAGLAAAHSLGLIHRDIKPANVLLEKGVVLKVKITDFGLARTADDASLTQSGTITGTPLYMAPEQAKGAKLDSRADLFSLGSVLYALACGHPPFRAATTLAVLRRVTEDTPRPLQEIIPETPNWFVAIVDKLLAKDPADRFQTAQEVADMLADSQSQVKQHVTVRDIAKIPDAKPRGRKIPSGKMVAYSGIAICLLAGIVAIAAGLFRRNLEPKPNDNSVAAVQPTKPTVQSAEPSPDRKAAEHVLSIGGEVRLHGVNREIQALADLPPEPFELAAIMLRKNKQVTDAGLAACSGCKKLTHLDLVETKITDTGVAHFAGNKNLVVLNLAHTSVSDEGLAHFQGNTDLTELWLGVMPKVTDRGMVYFKDCKKLTRLWLGGNYLTDKGVAHFKGCKNLLDLSVMNTSVTDQGLSHFQDCKNLKFLWLHGTKLTDTGLAYFNECHDLTEVYLDKTNFSNSWLTHLKNNKNLNTLSLTKTSASDGGLPLLKEFKNLKFLYLQETEITAAGIDSLKKSLPECRIEWNNGVIEPAATNDP